MTETLASTGGPDPTGPAAGKRRRLVVAGALLAVLVALMGAYLIRSGSGSATTATPVPHVVRSPGPAVPAARAPAQPPTGSPSPGPAVARNPFLPLVVAAPAASTIGAGGSPAAGTGAGTTGTTGTTGASPIPTASPGSGTGGAGTTGSDGGAATPAAPVDGTPNFTG